MPIRIKEIFRSDLDPNSTYWWSSDKLDKLNYNFGLLSLGGVPGPLGHQGNDGYTGETGFQGLEGDKGPQGNQGSYGFGGTSTWIRKYAGTSGPINDTLQPSFQGGPEFAAIPVIIGADSDPGNPDFSLYEDAMSWSSSVVTAYSKGFKNNISLDTKINAGGSSINKIGALLIKSALNENTLNYGKLGTGITLYSEIYMKDVINNINLSDGTNLLKIKNNYLESKATTNKFAEDVYFNNTVEYQNNSGLNKVLVSQDAAGNLVWEDQTMVFSALPVGSVISIRRSDFNNTNFHINDGGSLNETDNELHLIYGRGRESGIYEGWYLANGKTWEYDNGVIQHLLPNLNGFDYNIDPGSTYGGELGGIGGDNTIVVIGGADTSVNASYNNTNNNYDVDISFDSTDEILEMGASSYSSQASIHRNIQIVKLNEKNLYWRTNPGGTTAPTALIASAPADNSNDACSNPTQNYFITNYTVGDWSDTNNNLTSSTLYTNQGGNVGTIATANKWYASNSVARFWDGSSFTLVTNCPITTNLNLNYNLDVTSLNGTVVATGIYTIDGSDYINATTLEDSNGNNAGGGWYKIANDPNGLRRYWNGSQFLGESIDKHYVEDVSTIEFSFKGGSTACKTSVTPNLMYYATNTASQGPVFTNLHDIFNRGGIIYVHKDWIGTTVGNFPLVKVYSQNRPNGTSPWATTLDATFGGDVYYSPIKTDSGVLAPTKCVTSNTITGVTNVTPSNASSVDNTGGVITVNNPAGATLTLIATNGDDGHWATASVDSSQFSPSLTVLLEGFGSGSNTRTDQDQIILTQGTYNWTWNLGTITGSSIINLTISQ